MTLKEKIWLVCLLLLYGKSNFAASFFVIPEDSEEPGVSKEEKCPTTAWVLEDMAALQEQLPHIDVWTVQDIPTPEGKAFHILRLKYLKEILMLYYPKMLQGDLFANALKKLCGNQSVCNEEIKNIIANLKLKALRDSRSVLFKE